MLFTIPGFLALLVVLVVIHELGHFLTARAFGVRVLEFGIGFPPRIASFTRGEVVYSINALPIGGFVRLLGEEDPTEPRSLASRGALTRLAVLGAGVLMNLVLAVVLFTVSFMVPQQTLVGHVQVTRVSDGSPADEAGVRAGDIIAAVDGRPVANIAEVIERIRLKLGESNTWDLVRPRRLITGALGGGGEPGLIPEPTTEGERLTITLVPRWQPPPGEGNAGVEIRTVGGEMVSRSYPVWEAAPKGFQRMGEMLVLIRKEVTGWFVGTTSPQVGGAVEMARATGVVFRAGLAPTIVWVAFLSLNLAILNILPVPGLDGGRILLVLIEWLRRGKRVSPRVEAMVHLMGLMTILGLVIVVTYFDVVRVLRGESLLE